MEISLVRLPKTREKKNINKEEKNFTSVSFRKEKNFPRVTIDSLDPDKIDDIDL